MLIINPKHTTPEFTILMPCLNENSTLPLCISEAKKFISDANVSAEILIADNGSTDGSCETALSLGARVIHVPEKGYGNALIAGIHAATGLYIIMADCDYSYDFSNLYDFVSSLRDGYDFVIGNRFTDNMESHAMPFLHRFIGIPFLSFLGRKRFHTDICDFHCGLRGFSSASVRSLNLCCPGMEFATEMIALYASGNYKIKELPITFRKDKRKSASHLRMIPDGLRHLYFIMFKRPPA